MKSKTISSIIWSSIERFSNLGVQFIFSLIIARQLSPSDYGLIAMLSIFMALAQAFIDSGFSNALIQKQNRTNTDFSTAFFFNIIIGFVLCFIFIATAPLIASFYNTPSLIKIIYIVSLNFIINSLAVVQRAILTIRLDFKKQAWISLGSVSISGLIAAYMAYHGKGVWALVYQGLTNSFISMILLWITTKWYPQWCFSIKSFKELFSFGSKILASGLLNTLYSNLYSIIIGKFYATTNLGYFNRSSTFALYPAGTITMILSRVLYPIECQLQNNKKELQDKFFLFARSTCFFVFPLMIVICIIAEPLVRLVLTEKWIKIVPYMQILCFAYMWDPIMRMNYDIINAMHRSDYTLKAEIIKKIGGGIILFVTLQYGIIIMCIGLIVNSFLDIIIVTNYTKKILPQISFFNEMKQLFPILIQSIIVGGITYILFHNIETDIINIIISSTFLIVTYVLLSLVTKNKELTLLLAKLKNRSNL